jgi:SET domain-containing protein
MLVIKTFIDKSPIHGIGLFAAEDVPEGTIVWTFNPRIDSIIRKDEIGDVPEHVREFLTKYSWTDSDGHFRIGVDNDRFINHSSTPNTVFLTESYTFIASNYGTYSESEYAKSLTRKSEYE